MDGRSLSVGAVGEEVRRLHNRLRRLGYEIPESETSRAFFGPGTREAVRQIQLQHGLQSHGMVDEATNALIGETPQHSIEAWTIPGTTGLPTAPPRAPTDTRSVLPRAAGARRADMRREELPIDTITAALRDALTGPANLGAPAVIWSDRGSQIIMHTGKLQAHARDNALIVAVDTESAEFGPVPLIVRFVFGDDKDPASLVAATDDNALGHPAIAARWGRLFRDVTWAALVRLSVSHATRHGLTPTSLHVTPDRLQFTAEPQVSVPNLARDHVRRLRGLTDTSDQEPHDDPAGGPA
jgi:peptidoglycan hydrolase-like protein with peptidoglycan-binding domain